MHSFISLLPAAATLIASVHGAPAPDPNPGLDLLRRAMVAARSPSPLPQYEEYVPFEIDDKWCVWKPGGECWMNEVITYLYDYMKVDYPVYEYDYKDYEGIYASGKEASDEYQTVLTDLYVVINEHAGYDKYEYDYEAEIKDNDDPYCTWWYEGSCWFNKAVEYVDGVWPYKVKEKAKTRRQADKYEWSVYGTSADVQKDYATVVWDVLVLIDKYGPLDYEIPDGKA